MALLICQLILQETYKQCLYVNSVISVSSVAKKRHSAFAYKSKSNMLSVANPLKWRIFSFVGGQNYRENYYWR
ncbi:MAG: hypothetical protein JL50_15625 [Peptococcaceae bacterium BICA1-7]|nr:MAG: hypothetical protein JL50_15625 [Peptococcaceae bacterium BICA1-7]HBV96781.1 hypothetical protein [Desulfotomaculum sp.]